MSTNDEIREALERLVKAETKIIKGFPDDEAYASAAYEYGKALDHARSVLQRTAQKHPAVVAAEAFSDTDERVLTTGARTTIARFSFLAGWKAALLHAATTEVDEAKNIVSAARLRNAAAEVPESTNPQR